MMDIKFRDENVNLETINGQAFYLVDIENNIIFSGIGTEVCIDNGISLELEGNKENNVLIVRLPYKHNFLFDPINVYEWIKNNQE